MVASLAIIIVNWNSGPLLRTCLSSIRRAERQGLEVVRVIVVDNGSTDGSMEGLDDPELPLTVLSNRENLGFAAACNQGARASEADYLLFLNPDVVLFEDSLSVPVRFMEDPANRQVAVCGIQLVNVEGQVTQSCARFPTLRFFLLKMFALERFVGGHFLDPSEHWESKSVDQVMGAFFLVRREVFQELHGFDERFFVYFEELDFSYRLHRAGWRSHFLAKAQAQHVGGGCSDGAKAARLFYSLCSRVEYGFKHFGLLRGATLLLATAFIEPISRLALAVCHGSLGEARDTLKSYRAFWKEIPSLSVPCTQYRSDPR